MKIATAVTPLQMFVRLDGLALIMLGTLFWTSNALDLVPVHMFLGITLVLALWTLALVAAVVRVNPGLIALALLWGLLVPILGLTQTGLLPGSAHWLIQVLHLLVGLGAIGQAVGLAARIKGSQAMSRPAKQTQ